MSLHNHRAATDYSYGAIHSAVKYAGFSTEDALYFLTRDEGTILSLGAVEAHSKVLRLGGSAEAAGSLYQAALATKGQGQFNSNAVDGAGAPPVSGVARPKNSTEVTV